MNAAIGENKVSIEDQRKSVETLRSYFGEKYASIGALAGLTAQTNDLGKQVSILGNALNNLAKHVNATDSVRDADNVGKDSENIQKAIEQQLAPKEPVSKPTVFVQFAGGSRDQINELISAIGAAGKYALPGAERLGTAAGKHQIRYYYEEDQPVRLDCKRTLMRL
jgi:hypothetical protein